MVTLAYKPEATGAALNAGTVGTRYGSPTKVLIQPVVESKSDLKGHLGLLIAGPQTRWLVNFNEALPDAVYSVVASTYDSVEIGNSCGDCGLIIRPKVTRIDIEKLSMQAAVEIEVGVFDAYGYQVANFTALGKSPIMDMTRFSTGVAGYFIPFFGTVMGRNTVSITSRQALNKAIADFHDQIVEQTESGVLARHWLPKRENREYEIGNHQFPAERVAIAAGCRIGADKVRLVYQNYFAESFVASCWGKPSLAIDCEFGRCALREEYQTFNQ